MSTKEIIAYIESLPLSDRFAILEATFNLIKNDLTKNQVTLNHLEEVRQRRRNFKIIPFDLGEDVAVDRDQIYAERGL
jgi:phospholipid N-methyltransferase